MAPCMGIEVYKDTTSRLHGYGNALLVVDTFDKLEAVFQMCWDIL